LAERVAIGKSALSRLAISSLAALTGQWETAERLDRSLRQYLFARQLFDDLRDWKADLQARLPSLVLARVLAAWPQEAESTDKRTLASLSARIHYEGHATEILDAAVAALDRAAEAGREAPPFCAEIDRFRAVVVAMRNDLSGIAEKNVRRAEALRQESRGLPDLDATRGSASDPIRRALGYLSRQWRLGFGEARHLMVFDLERTGVDDVQSGDIFQRAIVADALLDGITASGIDLGTIVEAEADYLIRRRRKTRVGGWAYFPEFNAVPSDADDLAQVTIALLRSGRRADVETYCEPPLRLLLEECAHGDGSFETWILPRAELDDDERYQRYCAERYWGTGPDPEVVANLLYALALYDAERFAETIERGCAYLARVQACDGSWKSTWYHGPFYGAYVCTRALALNGSPSPALGAARDFLVSGQRADGSWGLAAEGDALSTAFALIALAQIRGVAPDPQIDAALALGHAYLSRAQDDDGSWPASDFIRMELGRPQNNVFLVLTYRSRTIATAFAVKALACAPR
jgi:squalene-hopene/tetraprenyl-beta-curcumene cyclase